MGMNSNEPKVTLTDKEAEMFADIKADIVNDVKNEIMNLGYTVIPQGYEGSKDLVKIVDKANQLKVAHEQECERIKQRYSKEVADSKLNVLEVDYKMDMESLVNDIDQVLERDLYFREQAIIELQRAKEYKEAKSEALNTLALLKGIDVPYETLADIIAPVVEAKDTKGLEIVKLLVGNNTTNVYLVDKAIENINTYKANMELHNFANSAKTFITTGKDEFTLFNYMSIYGGEK